MKFHKRHGDLLELSAGDTEAENKYDGSLRWSQLTIFSSEPVQPGQTITIKVLQAKHPKLVSLKITFQSYKS